MSRSRFPGRTGRERGVSRSRDTKMENPIMMQILGWAVLSAALALAPVARGAQEHEHDHDEAPAVGATQESDEEGEHGHEQEGVVNLTPDQIRAAGITVAAVEEDDLALVVRAPGEVVLNAYRTRYVTPRISAQVTARHVTLGARVVEGEPLVTLSSVEMAEAQGALLVADREWRRVKRLGRKVISERRYVEAQVTRQQAFARVLAYGMTEAQIAALLEKGDPSRATGAFDLPAPQAGTVIGDDFIVGELVEPGRVLFTITDESVLWVEARLNPRDAERVEEGAAASVELAGRQVAGRVVQMRHRLDEGTRTLGVRIEVPNPDDLLHPGQFVTAVIATRERERAIAVPLTAVLRGADGDWQVFVEEEPGRFEPHEVEVLRAVGDRMVVAGLEAGTRIVVRGAFFVQSELAKAGFEVHNH